MILPTIKRTEQIWLKPNPILANLCHKAKNLYNVANYIIRQELDRTEKEEDRRHWIRYNELYQIIKESETDHYKSLPAQTSQQILKMLDKSWASFFKAIKVWKKDPSQFLAKPNIPGYKKKDGQHLLVFTNQQVNLKDQLLKFSQKVELEINTRLPDKTDIREVRIIPKGIGYVAEIVYEKERIIPTNPKNPTKIVSIDWGVRNLVTMVNNIGLQPIVVKGGIAKSINQFYNKARAQVQSIYDTRNGMKFGSEMARLTNKRNRKIHDLFHKTSRMVIDYCQTNDIDTIVIGYNKDWKQNCRIGKRNTQNFVSIPFYKLLQQLEYKAEEQGIKVIKQEESHTSKCSFLDKESIEHHKKYMGRRISRGLFKSKNGTIINADVNGAYNILKKAIPKAFEADGIEGTGYAQNADNYHPSNWMIPSFERERTIR